VNSDGAKQRNKKLKRHINRLAHQLKESKINKNGINKINKFKNGQCSLMFSDLQKTRRFLDRSSSIIPNQIGI